MVNGNYSFLEFLVKIIFNIVLITTPLIILARRYVQILESRKERYLIIKGENKFDYLKIKQSELVCISNAQNYVEIYFLEEGKLTTKLIRSTLKQMLANFGFLMQVHRSHLINPAHFKSWKDPNTISLTKIDLPISKNYKQQILTL